MQITKPLFLKSQATKAIQAIVVIYNEKKYFNVEEFSEVFLKMPNLRLLIIDGYHILNAFNCVPNELKHLSLDCCPLKCLPSNFQPKELVQLDLKWSNFEYLWEGVKVILFF